MEYFNEQHFRDILNRCPLYEQRSYSQSAANASEKENFDLFLSYNIADYDVVKGIYYYLTKQGLKVYLDKMVDPNLDRDSTNKGTATIIRNRLEHSKALIYAQSPNSLKSNWMPWEIGVVDGKKGKCMILPVSDAKGNIASRREYLLLYPIITPSALKNFLVSDSGRFYSFREFIGY